MYEEPDYYAILGVEPSISAEELRRRHKILVRELHPDTHGGDAVFHERLTLVNVAFHELRDDMRRSAYDRRCREAIERAALPEADQFVSQNHNRANRTPAKMNLRTHFHSFNQPSAVRRVQKRRALLGSLIAAATACVLAVIFLFLTNDSFQLNLPAFSSHTAYAAAASSQPLTADALRKQQYLAIQELYQQRLDSVFNDSQQTFASVDQMASGLENEGDGDSAGVLRRDSRNFASKLLDIGNQVRMLGQVKSLTSELQMEASLSNQLDVARSSDRQLLTEEQNMKTNSQVSDGTFSTSSVSAPAVQKPATLPTGFSTP